MGYNTVAMFLNDMAGEVEGDPATLSRIKLALNSGRGNDDRQYMTLLPSEHADYTQVILAGQNRISRLPVYGIGWEHTPEALMRALAQDLGFSVRKKASRRKPAALEPRP